MNRRTFLRCVPAAPVAIAAAPAVALQAGHVEPDKADDREPDAICESCERALFEGDLVHACSDGPTFCEACAPTWGDIKHQYDEFVARGEFVDLFEDPTAAQDSLELVKHNVANGYGDKKHVWAL